MVASFVYKEEEITPDDILSAIFVLAWEKRGVSKPFFFRSHLAKLQEIFYGLQQEYPLLNHLIYSKWGPKPYSPMLDETLSRMQLSGLIGRENPDYEMISVKESIVPFYEKFVQSKFKEDEKKQLEAVAESFLKTIR